MKNNKKKQGREKKIQKVLTNYFLCIKKWSQKYFAFFQKPVRYS